MSSRESHFLSVLLVGDSGVGAKTCLLNRFVENAFYDCVCATIGADFKVKESFVVDERDYKLQIWDIAGQERFRSLGIEYYNYKDIFVVGYDVTDRRSLLGCESWIQEEVQKGLNDTRKVHVVVAVGNKIDLPREVSKEEAIKFFEEHGIPADHYFEASAKTGEGVNELFIAALRFWYEKAQAEQKRQLVGPVPKEQKPQLVVPVPKETQKSSWFSFLWRKSNPESEEKPASNSDQSSMRINSPGLKGGKKKQPSFDVLLCSPCCRKLKANMTSVVRNFEKTTNGDVDKEVSTVFNLISDTEREMKSLEPWKDFSDEQFAKAKNEMVRYVYVNLYSSLFNKKEYKTRDKAIRQHHDRIRSFVTPSFLKLNEDLVKRGEIQTAIGTFQPLDTLMTPEEKLGVFFSVYQILSFVLKKDSSSSIDSDELSRLLAFTIVNTPFESLYSNLQFIEHFLDASERKSELFDCFAAANSAVAFLDSISEDSMIDQKKTQEGDKGHQSATESKPPTDLGEEFFKLELPKEQKSEWSSVLSSLGDKKCEWEKSPMNCVMKELDEDMDESDMFEFRSFEKNHGAAENVLSFGPPGTQVPVNKELKAKIRLSLKDSCRNPFSFKFVTEKSFKYKLTASPSEGTISPKSSVDIVLSLKVFYTTTLSVSVPVVLWRGGKDNYENLVISKKGKPGDVFLCQLQTDVQSLPSTRLDVNELILYRRAIGEGGNAKVFRGFYRGFDIACKVLKNQEYEDLSEEVFRDFKREFEMFEALRHPCIVTFIGAVFVPRSLCLVTEFCQYGSLDKAIPKYGPTIWTLKMKVKALLDAARALEFLHKSSIIHRDMKPENLLVVSLEPNSSVVCKLSDFGTTKGTNKMVDVKMTKALGSPLYEAPEVLQGMQNYTNKVDSYSFGITMAFVADGEDPYPETVSMSSWQFANHIIGGNRPAVKSESDLPTQYVSLMKSCWDSDPTKRPDFSSIIEVLSAIN